MATHVPPPNPAPHGNRLLLWILGGIGAVAVLFVILALAGGFFVYSKVKQAGLDPALMKKNPALAAAKLVASVNPDVEVLSVNEDDGLITIRDKETGKTVQINLEDIQQGRIHFETDGDEKGSVTFHSDGESGGAIEVQSKEGTVRLTAGQPATLPAWIPGYPGAEARGVLAVDQKDRQGGSVQFTTPDSPKEIAEFYQAKLESDGFETNINAMTHGGQTAFSNLEGKKQNQKVTVVALPGEGNQTQVVVTYEITR